MCCDQSTATHLINHRKYQLSLSAYTLIRKRSLPSHSTKPVPVLRVKVIKVSCSKIQIKDIIKPILKVAAIALQTEKPSELPELSEIVEILLPAKVLLAKILTLATQDTFLAEELSTITATVCSGTGQCRVLVHHTRDTLDKVTQPYTLSFSPASELDLFHAYLVRHKTTSPNKLKLSLEKL